MKAPAQYFRAGVGAAIVNRGGFVLALERADIPGAWQLPQGGLQASESPLHAVFREVQEETGIPKGELELLDTYPEPLAYELPPKPGPRRPGAARWATGSCCGSTARRPRSTWGGPGNSPPGNGCRLRG